MLIDSRTAVPHEIIDSDGDFTERELKKSLKKIQQSFG